MVYPTIFTVLVPSKYFPINHSGTYLFQHFNPSQVPRKGEDVVFNQGLLLGGANLSFSVQTSGKLGQLSHNRQPTFRLKPLSLEVLQQR